MILSITPHPSWEIKDSSKLDDYIRCPRYYFYHHLLGWSADGPEHDLIFGEAFHHAREHQLLFGYDDVQGAYEAFIKVYRKEFPPETDNLYIPKVPAAILHALMQFAELFKRDLIDNEVVELDGEKMTEVAGTVPVDEKRVLHYRMDSIMRRREDGMIYSWDHKTTSGKWIHDARWDRDLFLSIQNGTYTHCLYCLFPIEQVLGVEFDKTGFEYLKKGSANRPAGYHVTTRRVPAYKTPEQMNTWLWLVNTILDEIERDMECLSHCTESDEVLMAFRQNPKACSDYRGCEFHDYCLAWQNPLRCCYEPPLGFITRFWNPMEREATVKKDLNFQI
ncbi:MAG: PD-(D/E)XK nuclease superfamily protein [Parcubacteria group bacterium ADurb.Bin216]|nr:MAG: PD-(D/E)XK nuclease superfamily protein [Parcubacteria group bacterium ADurb.Bin216]